MTEGTVANDREENANARDDTNVWTRRVGRVRVDVELLPSPSDLREECRPPDPDDPWADVPTPTHRETPFTPDPPY